MIQEVFLQHFRTLPAWQKITIFSGTEDLHLPNMLFRFHRDKASWRLFFVICLIEMLNKSFLIRKLLFSFSQGTTKNSHIDAKTWVAQRRLMMSIVSYVDYFQTKISYRCQFKSKCIICLQLYLCQFMLRICDGTAHPIITVRNEVAKVMFLQVSVCPRGGGAWSDGVSAPRGVPGLGEVSASGGCLLWGVPDLGDVLLPGGGWYPSMHWGRPPQRDGYCCGRYASYWNAFLYFTIQ